MEVSKLIKENEKLIKEIERLKEIEQAHQEENGKLRVELEKEKNKNKVIERFIKKLLNSKIGVDLSYDDYISKNKIREILDICYKTNGEFAEIPNGEKICKSDCDILLKYLQELIEEK